MSRKLAGVITNNIAPGKKFPFQRPPHSWIDYAQENYSFLLSLESVVLHGIDSVICSIRVLLDRICRNTP